MLRPYQTLKLRYEGYTTLTRATTLPTPTDLEKTIYETALELLRKEWRGKRKVRLIGVRGSNLVRQASYQLGLFAVGDERQGRLSRAVDEIRARYGEEAIVRASLLRKNLTGLGDLSGLDEETRP
jgi:DNA polymerase-4